MTTNPKDIFLCHAGEDKEKVARPLAARLESSGVSCWLDEAVVRWGESIVQKVNKGLGSAGYVIVILSPAFACGWQEVERQIPEASTDLEAVSRYKFVSRVYLQGHDNTLECSGLLEKRKLASNF